MWVPEMLLMLVQQTICYNNSTVFINDRENLKNGVVECVLL